MPTVRHPTNGNPFGGNKHSRATHDHQNLIRAKKCLLTACVGAEY
jgi:hypothetical protein